MTDETFEGTWEWRKTITDPGILALGIKSYNWYLGQPDHIFPNGEEHCGAFWVFKVRIIIYSSINSNCLKDYISSQTKNPVYHLDQQKTGQEDGRQETHYLNDHPCTEKMYFICKTTGTPDTASDESCKSWKGWNKVKPTDAFSLGRSLVRAFDGKHHISGRNQNKIPNRVSGETKLKTEDTTKILKSDTATSVDGDNGLTDQEVPMATNEAIMGRSMKHRLAKAHNQNTKHTTYTAHGEFEDTKNSADGAQTTAEKTETSSDKLKANDAPLTENEIRDQIGNKPEFRTFDTVELKENTTVEDTNKSLKKDAATLLGIDDKIGHRLSMNADETSAGSFIQPAKSAHYSGTESPTTSYGTKDSTDISQKMADGNLSNDKQRNNDTLVSITVNKNRNLIRNTTEFKTEIIVKFEEDNGTSFNKETSTTKNNSIDRTGTKHSKNHEKIDPNLDADTEIPKDETLTIGTQIRPTEDIINAVEKSLKNNTNALSTVNITGVDIPKDRKFIETLDHGTQTIDGNLGSTNDTKQTLIGFVKSEVQPMKGNGTQLTMEDTANSEDETLTHGAKPLGRSFTRFKPKPKIKHTTQDNRMDTLGNELQTGQMDVTQSLDNANSKLFGDDPLHQNAGNDSDSAYANIGTVFPGTIPDAINGNAPQNTPELNNVTSLASNSDLGRGVSRQHKMTAVGIRPTKTSSKGGILPKIKPPQATHRLSIVQRPRPVKKLRKLKLKESSFEETITPKPLKKKKKIFRVLGEKRMANSAEFENLAYHDMTLTNDTNSAGTEIKEKPSSFWYPSSNSAEYEYFVDENAITGKTTDKVASDNENEGKPF